MWTKSQKISAGILGLAVVAFLGDRFVLSGPEGSAPDTSAASSEYAVTKSSPSSTPAKPTPSAADATSGSGRPSSGVSLAGRLAEIGRARRLSMNTSGDAFRPSDVWLAKLLPPPPPDPKPAPVAAATTEPTTKSVAPPVDYAARFIKQHTLTAVMKKQSGGMAIIDGKLYAAGQTLDGFKLIRVGLNEATFKGKGTTAVLRMAEPPVADAR